MFQKYSTSRDFLYSFIITIILISVSYFSKINFINFDTSNILDSSLTLSGVLFGFILTIITMLFMFDPSKNPIFEKLQKDGLFNQIFKRFFDTLLVTGISLFIFLVFTMYFTESEFTIFKIKMLYSYIINPIIIFLMSIIIFRLYRCLNLLKQIYKVITHK